MTSEINKGALKLPYSGVYTEERWKDIVGFEGVYQISDLGNVRSLDRLSSCGRKLKGRLLSLTLNKGNGYVYVSLFKQGKKYNKRVHILVATHWVENPENLPVVHHKDHDKTNNTAINLKWTTQKENVQESIKEGSGDFRGSKSPKAKLNEKLVYNIKELLATTSLTHKEIAKKFDIEKSAISKIKRGITWSHVKYPLEN